MFYFDYQTARNLAWQVLLEQNILHLPVNMTSLCLNYGCVPLSYNRAQDIIKRYGFSKNCEDNDGFALRMKGRVFIFYNDACTRGRIRFTLAHELGHVLLGHLNGNRKVTTRNREPSVKDSFIEQQANVFASRLLAPACVIDKLNLYRPDQLMSLFGISHQSAEYRLLRMEIVQNRKKFGADFATHRLEKGVLRQLRPFIRWAQSREEHQRFEHFHIVRQNRIIGTTLGIVSARHKDVIALPPSVVLLAGDQLKPII